MVLSGWQQLRLLLNRNVLQEWSAPGGYRETLERLVRGDFVDVDPEARRVAVDRVIQVSTQAAMVAGMAPVPLLDLPVQATMVGAIAKVHGVRGSDRKLLVQLATALGSGALITQALRLVPVAGGLSRATRTYAATWALGYAADRYYRTLAAGADPPDTACLREKYAADLDARTQTVRKLMASTQTADRLRELEQQLDEQRITPAEFRRCRAEVLATIERIEST